MRAIDNSPYFLSDYRKICITGAGGWLGREFANLAKEILGTDFRRIVTLVGSKSSQILLGDEYFEVISWDNFLKTSDYDLIVHLAFLNQDICYQIGRSNYIQINRKITNDVIKSISSDTNVLVASSGAAAFYTQGIQSNNSYEIYAALKRESERTCIDSSAKKIVFMRIWNVSGINIDMQKNFALASFIRQAQSNGRIVINGNANSTRTYINAREMFSVYLSALNACDRIPIDSGGTLVTMRNLASEVLKVLALNSENIIETGNHFSQTHYNPDATMFDKIARNNNLGVGGIRDQLLTMLIE